jgi:hypothetical protein
MPSPLLSEALRAERLRRAARPAWRFGNAVSGHDFTVRRAARLMPLMPQTRNAPEELRDHFTTIFPVILW